MVHYILLLITGSYAGKILATLFSIGVTTLAVGEITNDRTLIIISAITSGTSLIGVIFGGVISYLNSRKLQVVTKEVEKVAQLPAKVEEFRKEVDGRMSELRESRMETSVARQEAAHAAGAAQERTEERERVDAAPAAPEKVEVVNKPSAPIPTIPVKKPNE